MSGFLTEKRARRHNLNETMEPFKSDFSQLQDAENAQQQEAQNAISGTHSTMSAFNPPVVRDIKTENVYFVGKVSEGKNNRFRHMSKEIAKTERDHKKFHDDIAAGLEQFDLEAIWV